MASLHPLPSRTIQPSSAKVQPPSFISFRRRGRVPASTADDLAGTPPSTAPEKPEIELEFVGPKPGEDGAYPVDRAKAISGEKPLRSIMFDNKMELYAAYGKVMNCGGGGSCETCIVEIIDGHELLNGRTSKRSQSHRGWPDKLL